MVARCRARDKVASHLARFATSIFISRPRPAVYRAYLDPASFPHWVDGYVGMETHQGELGGVGSEHSIFFAGPRGRVTVREAITANEPARSFAYVMHSPYTVSSVRVEFRDEDAGTRLLWENEVRGRNLLWSSLLPLIVPRMRRSVESNLGRLKSLIESRD